MGNQDGTKGIALHNPGAGRRRKSTSGLQKESVPQVPTTSTMPPVSPDFVERILRDSSPGVERSRVSAGMIT